MEIKRNEATINRPEGDRVIDAPFVFVGLQSFILQLKEEDAWKKNDRNGITVFKTGNVTVVVSALHEGAEVLDTTIDGIVSVQVIEGTVRINTSEGDMDLKEKEMVCFHPNTTHSIKATTEAVILITNSSIEK
jgi:quercetin dioxygenase-like cupin family protein